MNVCQGNSHRDPARDRLDQHGVVVGRLGHLQGHGQPQDLRLLPLWLHSHGHLAGQVQRHRVPHLPPVLRAQDSAAAAAGLEPGRPLLRAAVSGVQPGDPPSHLHLQAVHQHSRPHRPGPRATLLPLLLHTLLGPAHHRHAVLLHLHRHHNLSENEKAPDGQIS